jgi:hypothetical protein
MKTTLASVAVALLLVMSLASPAMAGSSGTISSKGPFTEADIYSVDSSGIYREIYVYASTSTDHQPGGPPAGSLFAYVIYLVVDTNTNTLIDEGSGLVDATPVVGKKLGSASVTAAGTAYSFIDNSAHTVSVDLNFTADSPVETESYVLHFSVGSAKLVEKFTGSIVDSSSATTGDATLDGVDLGSLSVYFSDFGVTKSSALTVLH